jgi:hypothetical protein
MYLYWFYNIDIDKPNIRIFFIWMKDLQHKCEQNTDHTLHSNNNKLLWFENF